MSSAGNSTQSTIATVEKVAETLLSIAAMAFPASATVLSIVKIATAVGQGVVAAEPSAVALFDEIKAVGDGGGTPTPQQWSTWDAAADKAWSDLDAAADLVKAGK